MNSQRTQVQPQVSVVIPAFNEQDNLSELVHRTAEALKDHNPWELVLVLDGCTDDSLETSLSLLHEGFPLRIFDLGQGYGQHAAIRAGLGQARGQSIVTLDADLQNPPEAIPDIVDLLQEGADAVGTIRKHRQDSTKRQMASALFRSVLATLQFRHQLKDPGCMLRGWRRSVVTDFLATDQRALYLPLQINEFAHSYAEIKTAHHSRHSGKSQYTALKLARLFTKVLALKHPFGVPMFPPPQPVAEYS